MRLTKVYRTSQALLLADRGTAPPLLRARCLAAFDLDPSKEEALVFGARSHLRLRITIDDGIATSASTLVHTAPDHTDVRETMELVQLEAFEEEIFGEVSSLT